MSEKTVILDAGHGGNDPGAVKYGQEHEYALSIVKEVAKRLPSSIRAVLTRNSKNALDDVKARDLKARCAVSDKFDADLFVSIHLNAGNGTGYETLVYSSTAQDKTVHAEIKKVLDKYKVRDRGIKVRDDVYVLKGTKAKALLLEICFIDNKSDMALLDNQTYFHELCQAIADGIAKAVGVSPKTTKAATITPGRYRVYTGQFTSLEAAEDARDKIAKAVGFNPTVRKED